MSFYSFGKIKIVSRNGAKSAVASAAYQAGIELVNEYDGVVHDYSEKKNVGETFICLPESTPEGWRDESVPAKDRLGQIWNSIEKAHSADNARLARSNYIALPHSLTLEQGLECVDRFVKENCTDKGMGAIYTPHLTPGNHHVDVMYFVSEYDKKGKPKEKSKKEYLCRNKDGEERYMDAESFKKSKGYEKIYKYQKDGEKANLTPSEASEREGWERINKYPLSRKIKVSGWDDLNLAKEWRKAWEVILNEKFEELGMKDRVDCRSYEEQGISKLPTIHEGYGSDKKERQEYNRQIKEYNRELAKLHSDAIGVFSSMKYQLQDLSKNPQTEKTLEKHEELFNKNEQILNQITEAGLFSDTITNQFKAKLREFKEWMDKWLGVCKKALHDRNIEPKETITEEPVRELKKTFDDMFNSAQRRSDKHNSNLGRERKRENGPER